MGEFVHVYNDGGGIRNVNVPNTPLSISGKPKAISKGDAFQLSFDDMVPKIFPSLVAGTTAVQSGSTVTVTATAHGIPATTYDGWKVWYPGSTNIPAGWYSDFQYLTVNTFSFTAADNKTVASESVNGGSYVSAYTEIVKTIIPGNSMGKDGRITCRILRGGDTTSGNKQMRTNLGGTVFNSHATGTSPAVMATYSIFNMNSEAKQRCLTVADGTVTATISSGTVDTTQDQVFSITVALVNASQFFTMYYAELEVRRHD